MTLRIEALDEGYIVVDTRGPRTWRAAAVTEADALALAENRISPRIPSAPPRPWTRALERGEPFDAPEFPPNCEGHSGEFLAQAQHEAATDGDDCTATACLVVRGSGD